MIKRKNLLRGSCCFVAEEAAKNKDNMRKLVKIKYNLLFGKPGTPCLR